MAGYREEAQASFDRDRNFRDWYDARIAAVHDHVSAYDVLNRYGVKLRYGGGRGEQMFCPFHGNTKTMAAKYHPKDVRSPDHVWCFVCNERWDCIKLFQKFENLTADKFTVVLRSLERAYGIIPPERPPSSSDEPDDHETEEIDVEFAVAESRLKYARKAFDMKGYLTVGSILDRLRWQFENQKVLPSTVHVTLVKVLDKIGQKARSCPED